ncbi:MAG: hypothetical protein H0T79_09125 [Deltaproteobacteria bacterium]|nr:hypothetical protein [Deltaproteobacteria bacterium]
MRTVIAITTGSILALGALGVLGCGKGAEQAGIEAAKAAQEAELKASRDKGEVAKKIVAPVPGNAHVACETLIDTAAFTTALGEKEPLTVRDDTKKDGDAAASCALIRGGKRPNPAEQAALLKKQSRLGVLPGDPVCQITAYCWTIEALEPFRKKCADRKERDDDSMGSYACIQVVGKGADDFHVYRFFDEDTKCIIKATAEGPNIDNDQIRTCAKTARDTIGLPQITPGAAPPPAAPAGSGSDATK